MKYLFLVLVTFLFIGCPYDITKYRVYYHSDDSAEGSPPKDSKEYSSGEMVTLLEKGNLKKGDYAFIGWDYYGYTYKEWDNITVQSNDINLYAVWDDETSSLFSYKIEDGKVTITGYKEQTWYITIPDTLQSKPVIAIDDNAFGNWSIVSVHLPKNLSKIGIGAFASNEIIEITIPDNVTDIGTVAFRNNKLKKITLGTGITSIKPYTFAHNDLKDITIPKNIKSIGKGAFNENDIDIVNIGDGVAIEDDTSLGTYGASFLALYNVKKQAGLYIYIGNDVWERH